MNMGYIIEITIFGVFIGIIAGIILYASGGNNE